MSNAQHQPCMLNATQIIRRLALALKKPRGHIPRARSKQRGIFLLWRGILAARAIFATADYDNNLNPSIGLRGVMLLYLSSVLKNQSKNKFLLHSYEFTMSLKFRHYGIQIQHVLLRGYSIVQLRTGRVIEGQPLPWTWKLSATRSHSLNNYGPVAWSSLLFQTTMISLKL